MGSVLAKAVAFVIVVGVVFVSCRHAARPIVVGPGDSGKALSLVVGATVTVRLDSSPSTGYRWEITTQPDERMVLVVDSGYDRPESDAVGAPGQAWWKLRATGPGSTTLSLRYVRPWEPDHPARMFEVKITVE